MALRQAPGPYSIDLFADDLSDLLDAAGWKDHRRRCMMGGSIALWLRGEIFRAAALASDCSTPRRGDRPEPPSSWKNARPKLKSTASPASSLSRKHDGLATRSANSTPKWSMPGVATFLANDVGAYAETCRMLGNFDLRASLEEIAVPTAIAVGEEDYATPPSTANDLHAAIKHSTLTIIKAGGISRRWKSPTRSRHNSRHWRSGPGDEISGRNSGAGSA